MARIERKYLAHYIDATFGEVTPDYVRLGTDLEEFAEELNPDVEVQKNILGEQKVSHNGYEVQSEVDPYYADFDDPLFEKLKDIALERKTGDACKSTKVDVLLKADGTVDSAYREDVYVIPNSFGGDTSGVQIPFTVYNAGNRTTGTWNPATKVFTASAVVETYTYTECVGLSAFAQGVTYYTEANGVYTAVATGTAFDTEATYYTRNA